MRSGLYFRLAGGNIRKNGKIYFPYILTCVCIIAVFYITAFLSQDPGVRTMNGGRSLSTTLTFGYIVVALFSAIFLFYTNSFIVKRRRRELGLYNILGMAKRNIAAVMFIENAMVALIGLILGLSGGVLLSKLAQMCLFKLMGQVAPFDFYVNLPFLAITAAVYSGIFLLIYLGSLRKLGTASPIELLRESSVGEREPKGNILIALAGLAFLVGGYWLALSVKDPIEAMAWFFVAVILVIIGTYLCFISGSVTFLRLLKKNKRYYYSKKHFVPVSGMGYRMKRNGAGLASICILSTMVLVTLSSVMSLYIGADASIRERYNWDLIITVQNCGIKTADVLDDYAADEIKKTGLDISDIKKLRYFSGYVVYENGKILFDPDSGESRHIVAVAAEDVGVTLSDGEALVSCGEETGSISFDGWRSYKVTGAAEKLPIQETDYADVIRVVLPGSDDIFALTQFYNEQRYKTDETVYLPHYCIEFDVSGDQNDKRALLESLEKGLGERLLDGDGYDMFALSGYAQNMDDFLATYSGLLFIGLLLGAVFVVAAVLIMYYKQVSEGYEDQSRFGIMQKVGMTGSEIRSSVNSQILTVFFLPLAVSALHMAFAFPMIERVLRLFGLLNVRLFLAVTAGVFLVFALFYVVVYAVTSKAYISIISVRSDRRTA